MWTSGASRVPRPSSRPTGETVLTWNVKLRAFVPLSYLEKASSCPSVLPGSCAVPLSLLLPPSATRLFGFFSCFFVFFLLKK